MRPFLPPVGFALALAFFAYATRLPSTGVLVTLAMLAVMALPGVLLVRWALPAEASSLNVLVFGGILGLAIGRFALAASWLVFGPGPLAVGFVLVGLAVMSAVALARLGRSALPSWSEADSREGCWLLGLLALVILSIAIPYWGVGRETPDGHAFTPYFNRDYMNHVAVTAEVSRGLPPQNPYFAGERLHYYWGSHLWPAAVKSLTSLTAREALNLTLPATVGLFIAALVLWLRLGLPGRAPRYGAVALGLFAFSYVGPLLVLKLSLPQLAVRLPVVSASEYSFLSHSWFRDFLYEPHAVTALGLLLAILFLGNSLTSGHRSLVGCLIGIGFGAMAVTDAFLGLVGLLYFALTNLRGFFSEPSARRPLLIAATITVAVIFAAVALGIFPTGGRAMRLRLHPVAKLAPAYLLLDLGPLFVFGVAGAALLVYRRRVRALRPLFVLLALALVIGFTLQVPAEPNIVLRKSLKVAQVPLCAFAAAAFLAIATSRRRALWGMVVAVVVVPGMSTLVTDNVLYLDLVEKRYPPTTYVSDDEHAMLRWVRTNTPPDAVLLLGYPDRLFGEETPLLIEALAERRTYYGNDELPKMFQVPQSLIAERQERVRVLFAGTRPDELELALRAFPPVYLYLDESRTGSLDAYRQLEVRGVIRHVHQSGRFSLKRVVPPLSDGR